MRRALVVGIDHYQEIGPLNGCVNDAKAVEAVLARHEDSSVNFHVKAMLGERSKPTITRRELMEAVKELFAGRGEVAFLYFAGHGCITSTGGYLCVGDTRDGDDGLALGDIMTLAGGSDFQNKMVVLDSCHSGIAGNPPGNPKVAQLSDGMTILTASTADQYASEENGSGLFTSLFVDALQGAAANVVGEVTPGAAYAHVDQSLGAWAQRPVFKTNVERFVSLRKVRPPLPVEHLRAICRLFPKAGYEFKLDPSFEPERGCGADPSLPPPKPQNTEVFAILQAYARVNLAVPVGAPHMWHAAMGSKATRLTPLGEHYRRLAAKGFI